MFDDSGSVVVVKIFGGKWFWFVLVLGVFFMVVVVFFYFVLGEIYMFGGKSKVE